MSQAAPPPDLSFLFHAEDTLERRNEKLLQIAGALIRQVEDMPEDHGTGYAQFQRAAMLEDQVRARTQDLERALDLLNTTNTRLAAANRETEAARQNLAAAIETVQEGFALFDPDDVMVMCNSRFNALLPDILDRLRPGLGFDAYLELAASSAHLVMPEGMSPADWVQMRRKRHAERHFILTQGMGADRWMQISEHRTRDGGTVILQTEVTDLLRREREERGRMLDDQALILRATLEHLKLGVCIFDARLHLLGWNDKLTEFLTLPRTRVRQGMQFDQLLAQVQQQFVFPHGLSAHRISDWVRRVRRRDSFSIEVTREGGAQVFEIFAQEVPGGGFVMSFDDVSAERRALEDLSRANETLEARVTERTLELEDALSRAERANASRARFVAAASHDLLQPLSAATLYLTSLQHEPMGERAQKTISKVQRSLDSVEGLLSALLDISRLESGYAAVTLEPVALGPLFRQLRDEFAPLAARKGLELVIRPVEAVVISDQVYLRRILQNLISNAIRYTATGRVFVGLRRRGAMWLAEVRDSGPGIAPADQEAIFREFHRLGSGASAAEGLGLGLAIVERAASLLGHPLSLRSAPGCGSTFALTLTPAIDAPVELPTPAPAEEPRADEQSGLTLLLVENDAELSRAMTELLEKWGLTVLDVTSGEAALDLIAETEVEPDLCLVDHQLGEGMDGLACLTALRMRFGPDLRMRLVTANRSEEVQNRARDLGIEVMMKPVAPRALNAFIFGAG
ncbi:hybrid sensor histidine kinase/response regulator [Paracoccus aminophilus]|uniref:histidine kinase n=1 Tax=Paracoccus aminophilus JCM 7686 TaxID=1367847 RepID=S5Y7F6_PARAH|nr:PAS-domain containing protein [Paracoccus aminophilus]AGT07268.1 PAS/PAC sensor hybrid histidine kinase [Paracoccus aminophilus JCM 7686]